MTRRSRAIACALAVAACGEAESPIHPEFSVDEPGDPVRRLGTPIPDRYVVMLRDENNAVATESASLAAPFGGRVRM